MDASPAVRAYVQSRLAPFMATAKTPYDPTLDVRVASRLRVLTSLTGHMTSLGTVGIAFPGDPRARGTWSGTPAGIAEGLSALGYAVVRLDARPPRVLDMVAFNATALAHTRPGRDAVRRGRATARVSPTVATVRGAAMAARLRRSTGLDAVVQIGTGYAMPAGPRVATFEDMTVPQALALGYPGWDGLSARAVRARIDRQRRSY